MFTVDGKEVDYREALLMLLAAKEEAEILYGKGIWDYTLDEEGTTYAMLRKEQVLEELINTHVACLHAAELGVDIYVERQDAMFAETFNRWKEQAEIMVNEEKWAALQP